MKPIKIKVRGKEHGILVQKILHIAGYLRGTLIKCNMKYLYGSATGQITWGSEFHTFDKIEGQEVDFDWCVPETHTITIDGKDIELSKELYENLKEQLT